MPIGTISNGESGLSVRTKLNEVINVVNTGITGTDYYVTGGTYNNGTGTLTLNRQNGSVNVTGFLTGVTETQNLENVLALGNTTGANDIIVQSNILVGSGNRIQETISGNTFIEINQNQIDIVGSDGGVNSSYLNVSDISSTLSSTDGSDTSTLTITPTGILVSDRITDTTGNNIFEFTNVIPEGGVVSTSSTPNYTGAGSSQLYFISPNSTSGGGTGLEVRMVRNLSTNLFGIQVGFGGNQVITNRGSGYEVGDTITFLGTQYGLSSPANDVTYTILSVTSEVNKIDISSSDELANGSAVGLTSTQFNIGVSNGNLGSYVSGNIDFLSLGVSDDATPFYTGLEFDPTGTNNGIRLYAEDGVSTITSIELDPLGNSNGNRLYATDGTNTSTIGFDNAGYGNITVEDGGSNVGALSVSTTGSLLEGNDIVGGVYNQLNLEVGNGYELKSLDINNGIDTKLYGNETSSTWEATSGVSVNSITLTHNNINISNLPSFDDDTDASSLTTGDLYQTTGLGTSPLDVAGILMVKQ